MLNKKQILLLITMAAILIAAPILAMCATDDGREEERTRVLTLWQVDSFEGGRGSRTQYLQDVAETFFDGTKTYVTVTSLSADAARGNIAAGNVPARSSYGAGFYGIETLINPADFTYICWCRGAYLLICLDDACDFSDVTPQNTVINEGRDNLVFACALFEGLSGATFEAPTSAYVSLINGKYKYLLGTQRDICRLETREQSYKAKVVTSFNDLYQNISILNNNDGYSYCRDFCLYLNDVSQGVASLGMVSDGAQSVGIRAEMQSAEYEYAITSFVGETYINEVKNAINNSDLNSLKNLLK